MGLPLHRVLLWIRWGVSLSLSLSLFLYLSLTLSGNSIATGKEKKGDGNEEKVERKEIRIPTIEKEMGQLQDAWSEFQHFNKIQNYVLYTQTLVLSGICRQIIDFVFHNNLLITKPIKSNVSISSMIAVKMMDYRFRLLK